jgi:hypothetical protein
MALRVAYSARLAACILMYREYCNGCHEHISHLLRMSIQKQKKAA